MTPAQKLWHLIKPHVPGHVNRIENTIGSGIPDVNYCYNGQEFWLELKAGNDKLRDSQKIWHMQRTKAGGKVLVLTRKDDCIDIVRATETLGEYFVLIFELYKPWDWKLIEDTLKEGV